MKPDQVFETLKKWIYRVAPRNVSNQDQFSDHFMPHCAETFFLLTIPKVGIYLGLLPALFALWKEFWEDKHYKDFFTNDDGPYGGSDGRCDLFFRLAGSAIAYLTLLWR